MKTVQYSMEFEVPQEYLDDVEQFGDELVAMADEECEELRDALLGLWFTGGSNE